MVYKTITNTVYYPDTVKRISDSHFFIRFKETYFGKPQLILDSQQTDTIVVKAGEKSILSTHVDTHPPGTVRYLIDTLLLKKGSHIYDLKIPDYAPPDWAAGMNYNIPLPDSIGNLIPFRYIEIEGYKGKLKKNDVRQIAYFYPFNDSASFCNTSSVQLNRVWHLCKHSIKATNFTGLYIDGDRERRPYEADAYINQLSHYAVDSEYAIARRTIDYLFRNPTWPTEWHFHMPIMLWEDYMYTGKSDYLKIYYDSLKRIVDTVSLSSEGLLLNDGNDIIDWPQSERDGYQLGKINNVPNAFYYNALLIMAKIAGVLNNKADSVSYEEKATRLKTIFNSYFWNKQTGLYIDCTDSLHSSIHANIFPVVFGLASPAQTEIIRPFIKSKGMAVSVYGAQYLLDALFMMGEATYAEDLMTADNDRSWLHMMDQGGTITWEAWNAGVKSNLDWNHAWGTAPANIIVRRIFGIRPLQPGFQKTLLQPQFGELKYGRIKVPTINGIIWMVFDNSSTEQLSLQITMNMEGELVLSLDSFNLSGVTVNNDHYEPLVRDGNMIIEVPAGNNSISCLRK